MEAYGVTHLVMLAIFVCGLGPIVLFGRAHRGDQTARRSSTSPPASTWAPRCRCTSATWPGRQRRLPCGRRHPYFVGLAYFWGLTLTIQAVVTPSLGQPFPEPRFIGYWGMHLLVVWAAVYLVWGLGMSPRWREYGTTVLTTVAWVGGGGVAVQHRR